jgi:hypothetical protein
MGILSAIVQVAALTVLDIRQALALRHPVAFQLVGDENARHVLQPLQETLEEALCRAGIAAGLDQNIKHDAVLIDSAPEIMQLALDPNEHLVQVPLVTGSGPAPTQIAREARAKLQAPAPDALVGDKHAALRQEQLDVPKAQAEYMVEPNRVADELGREAVTVVRVRRLLHATILARGRPARQGRLT